MRRAGHKRCPARVGSWVSFWGRKRSYGSAPAALLAGLAALTVCGCETTQEKSAALERQAKHTTIAQHGVSVAKENPSVQVLSSAVVRSSEGTAVAVTVRNTSVHTLAGAPIELTVSDAKGGMLYRNNAPGLQPSLTELPLLAPGKTVVWVDDQVQLTGTPAGASTPASASALVGEAKTASTAPKIEVTGAQASTTGPEASESGSVVNRSAVAQANLVVYAVARRGGTTVAAGRAVLPEVAAGTKVPFQIYFVGNPKGAQIEVSAPATTF
jgi:hypothetical protein